MSSSEETLSIPPDKPESSKTTSSQIETPSKCSFLLSAKLGEGSFGTVRLGINAQTGEPVAIKILEKCKIIHLVDKTRVERETAILKYLRHPNIVHLYDVLETDEKIYLIMEYIPGKELFNYIVEKKRLSEKEACKIYQQIIAGIEYLHKLNVVHRDIKPENLLIDPITQNIKIVDFGLSNQFSKANNNLLKSACGSPCYAAPEMLSGEDYKATPIDIWSTGIVLYAMICGYLPFEDENNEKLFKKIKEGKYEVPNFVSKQAKDLLSQILNVNPKKRITIPQIKRHDWFNFVDSSANLREGLLINKTVIPIDEDIIDDMVKKYGFESKEEVRASVLSNRHNDITIIYYLALRKKIGEGKKSIADLKSDLFVKYSQDKENLFEKYNFEFAKVVASRKHGKEQIRKTLSAINYQRKRPDMKLNLGIKVNTINTGTSFNTIAHRPKVKEPLGKTRSYSKGIQEKKRKMLSFNKILYEPKKVLSKAHISPTRTRIRISSAGKSTQSEKAEKTDKIQKPVKIEKNEKTVIPEKIEKPFKPEKIEKPFKAEKIDKPFKAEKIEKLFKPLKIEKQDEKAEIVEKKEKVDRVPKVEKIDKSLPNIQAQNVVTQFNPLDLSCLSFKNYKTLFSNLEKLLKRLRIKYRISGKRIVIEKIKDNLLMEVRVCPISEGNFALPSNPICYTLKFKRLMGVNSVFRKMSKNIISKLDF